MHKRDYFIKALELKLYEDRKWILRVMGTPAKPFADTRVWQPSFDGTQFTVLTDQNETVVLEGYTAGLPLYPRDESVVFNAGDFPNLTETTQTAYSTAILNHIIFVYPFKTPMPYIAGRFNGKTLNKRIVAGLQDKSISVDEYVGKFNFAMGRLTAFTQIAVTAATPRSIRPTKKALEIRDKLLSEATPEQLQDPVYLAIIDETVSKIDAEELADDESARFFLKGKAYSTVRKKMFTIQGGLVRLDDPSKMDLLPTSLEEGIRPEDLPAAINNLRSGSYGRAKDTALGGEAAKFANRVFQNLRIGSPDCGSVVGLPVKITNSNYEGYVGRYLIGSDKPLTGPDLRGLVDKEIIIRDPNGCKEGDRNYCARCMGDRVSTSEVGLGAQYGAVGNVFMAVALASFHGGSLKTAQTKLSRFLS
jgi:hypothetical protein